jgi:hypothetical protein
VTARIESGFHMLPETHEVYSVWRNLVPLGLGTESL